ncbi:MAG: hypothetical protein ACI857_000389 [Arenicella sp.]
MKIILFLFFSSSVFLYAQPVIQVDTLINFTKEDSASLSKELDIMQSILNSDLFWKLIMAADFQCRSQRIFHFGRKKRKSNYPMVKKDKKTYTNQEIHDLLWFGDDEIGTKNDAVINLKLKAKTFEPNKNGTTTHGSTNKNSLIISSSPKTRINNKTPGVYACHLIHEYIHVLGFKHKSNNPTKNKKKCEGIDVVLGIQNIAVSTLNKIRSN